MYFVVIVKKTIYSTDTLLAFYLEYSAVKTKGQLTALQDDRSVEYYDH